MELRERDATLEGLEAVASRLEGVARDLREAARVAREEAPERLMTAEEVAREVLNIPADTFERIARERDVPRHYLSPRVIRYSPREVYEWAVGAW